MTIEFVHHPKKRCDLEAGIERLQEAYEINGEGTVNVSYDFNNSIWLEIPAETKFQMKARTGFSKDRNLGSLSNASAVVHIDDYTYIISRKGVYF